LAAVDKIRCPSCDGVDIRHSLQRGILDAVMSAFGKSPRRCRFCERRFYVPHDRTRAAAVEAQEPDSEAW
jgi:hypothetical protein